MTDRAAAPGLKDFAGRWRLDRRIDDRLSGQVLTLAGEARFVPDDTGLICHESGILHRPGARPMQAERRYLWREDPAGGIAVFFADGRPFHRFDPSGGGAGVEASHWCDPDDYRVRYDFSAWPVWTARWRVDGPRKSYGMQSRYDPA